MTDTFQIFKLTDKKLLDAFSKIAADTCSDPDRAVVSLTIDRRVGALNLKTGEIKNAHTKELFAARSAIVPLAVLSLGASQTASIRVERQDFSDAVLINFPDNTSPESALTMQSLRSTDGA